MNKIFIIAIDGPGGAGKSTIAKMVAKKLKIDYIDTGSMYRAIGYKVLCENINIENQLELEKMLNSTTIDFCGGDIILDGKVVNELIRTPEISRMASEVSAIESVRDKLVALQRNMGNKKSLVMDGRDIGTNVFSNADLKFFMTASNEERAKRRYEELKSEDKKITYEEVLNDINQRDFNDTHRKINPLKVAKDAIVIDTTGMQIREVVDKILREVNDRWQY